MSSSSSIELDAPAKLNLFLEVLGRRPDGYHEIDSIFAAIDLCDTVRVEPAAETTVTVAGLDAPAGPGNLAYKAAEALGVKARIHLQKRIPLGAGLGGGSSDAAAVLKALGGGRPSEALDEIARSLGADVPFFLRGGTARCRGIGDKVEPLQGGAGRAFLLLVPDFPMDTAAVYRRFDAGLTENRRDANVFQRRYFGTEGPGRAPFFNRLQGAAEILDGRLRVVREKAEGLYGTAFTMSGTGSSYFAEWPHAKGVEGFVLPGNTKVRAYRVETA